MVEKLIRDPQEQGNHRLSDQSSRGNALFLILIAVALFAALSYAVTKSGRGGGTISKEKALLDAASLVNFGNAINAAVQRMIITGTAAPDTLVFETAFKSGVPCSTGDKCVFAPEGGGLNPPFPLARGNREIGQTPGRR